MNQDIANKSIALGNKILHVQTEQKFLSIMIDKV